MIPVLAIIQKNCNFSIISNPNQLFTLNQTHEENLLIYYRFVGAESVQHR